MKIYENHLFSNILEMRELPFGPKKRLLLGGKSMGKLRDLGTPILTPILAYFDLPIIVKIYPFSYGSMGIMHQFHQFYRNLLKL
jgi:hypothetical protein